MPIRFGTQPAARLIDPCLCTSGCWGKKLIPLEQRSPGVRVLTSAPQPHLGRDRFMPRHRREGGTYNTGGYSFPFYFL